MIPSLRLLASIISRIVYFFKAPDAIVDNLYEIINYMARIRCNETLNCDYPTSEKFDAEFGALPVATRCWADYSPEIDTSSAFSCTSSDTCRVSNLEYGQSLNKFGLLVEDGNQIVCDACPLQPGGLVNQFGCDTYTKQCTCNRCVFPCARCSCMCMCHVCMNAVRAMKAMCLVVKRVLESIGVMYIYVPTLENAFPKKHLFPATFGLKSSVLCFPAKN